ncbi:hypothetical protein FACS1894125_0050 [Actinomycetota bacterium]|nr:hypothetical protein FACS1894125_0050 [Actinomycetota bacterium]
MNLEIVDDPEQNAFLAVNAEGDLVGSVMYQPRPAYLDVWHTGVEPDFEGLGVAGKMTQGVLEMIRTKGQKVFPRCPYMEHWLQKHPEFDDVVYK